MVEVEVGAVVRLVAGTLEPRDQRGVPVCERLAAASRCVEIRWVSGLHDASGAPARPPESHLEAGSRRLVRPQRLCVQAAVPRAVVGVVCRPRELVERRVEGAACGRADDEEDFAGLRSGERLAVGPEFGEQREICTRAPVPRHCKVVGWPAPVTIRRAFGQVAAGEVGGGDAHHRLELGAPAPPCDPEARCRGRDVQRERLAGAQRGLARIAPDHASALSSRSRRADRSRSRTTPRCSP